MANAERAAKKSASAFRTISEVSEELEVQPHVLRFWESKFSQVRPMKRAGGRRYYRPEDVDLLRRIRGLLYDEGYTIKGVQKQLRDSSARNVRTLPSKPPRMAKSQTTLVHDATAAVEAAQKLAAGQNSETTRGASGSTAVTRVELERIIRELESIRDRLDEVAEAE